MSTNVPSQVEKSSVLCENVLLTNTAKVSSTNNQPFSNSLQVPVTKPITTAVSVQGATFGQSQHVHMFSQENTYSVTTTVPTSLIQKPQACHSVPLPTYCTVLSNQPLTMNIGSQISNAFVRIPTKVTWSTPVQSGISVQQTKEKPQTMSSPLFVTSIGSTPITAAYNPRNNKTSLPHQWKFALPPNSSSPCIMSHWVPSSQTTSTPYYNEVNLNRQHYSAHDLPAKHPVAGRSNSAYHHWSCSSFQENLSVGLNLLKDFVTRSITR